LVPMATHEFEFDVFLSHNSKDKPRVRRVAEELKRAGLRVWLDEWVIAPGDDIYLSIERGLESSRTLVLFLSPAAIGSDWVGLERSTALFRDPTNKARRFVPVLLEDCQLPDTLRRYAYLDFRTEEDAGVAALIAASKGMPLATPSPPQAAPPRPAPAPGKKRGPRAQPKPQDMGQVLRFGILAAAGFLGFLLVLWILLANTEMLARFGLTGQLFYVALIPLALSASVVLFGSLRSVASFQGKVFGGLLEMGGPAVLFVLVLVLGFVLVPQSTPFSVTFYVHGQQGTHDLVLHGKGAVILDLDQHRRREEIGAEGQAVFSEIAPSFRDREVPVGLAAEGFALAESSQRVKLTSSTVYLEVQRLEVEMRGSVIDNQSRPIPGATIRLREKTVSSETDGTFVLRFPGEWTEDPLMLRVNAPGFKSWQAEVFAGSNAVDVMLDSES